MGLLIDTLKGSLRIAKTSTVIAKTASLWMLGDRPPNPKLLRTVFEELGATYIKLGQFIASSPTFFPQDYVEEFQNCLDKTKPFEFSIAKKIIELQNADFEMRDKLIQKGQLGQGYNEEMAQLHNRNAEVLNEIINKIGYPTIEKVGTAIRNAFSAASGEAHDIGLKLGMSEPSFASISRSIKILLSNGAINDFEPGRNGLGLNNVLYISMILEYFERRAKAARASGQLLLIEEPESHLHPQLQTVLYNSLAEKPFQAILTTHSTHISSHAPLDSYVTLTTIDSTSTQGCTLKEGARLSDPEAADLNRFLEATRSTLLYARKVILVEGPSELFLISAIVKSVMNIDLDRHGISIIPIYGTHFGTYAKLFTSEALHKKCAIITDGDLATDELPEDLLEDAALEILQEEYLETNLLRVFKCPVTFERAITIEGTLPMFLSALRECEYPTHVQTFENAINELSETLDQEEIQKIISPLRGITLSSAKRCGKSRFAQIASKYASEATATPDYISRAVTWIMED